MNTNTLSNYFEEATNVSDQLQAQLKVTEVELKSKSLRVPVNIPLTFWNTNSGTQAEHVFMGFLMKDRPISHKTDVHVLE